MKIDTLPTGTVTFLFTDVERSTHLWEEHPEAMKAALARHDQIVCNAIDAQTADEATAATSGGDATAAPRPAGPRLEV